MHKQIQQADIDEIYYHFLVARNDEGALRKLASLFDAHGAAMLSVNEDRAWIRAEHNVNPYTFEMYATELGEQDPLFWESLKHPDHTPLTLSRCTDLKETQKTEYYNEILAPSDIGDMMSLRTDMPTGQIGLSLHRDKKRPHTSKELALANEIYPHLARCLRLLQRTWILPESIFSTYSLTIRESEIIDLIQHGLAYEQICDELRISKNTLKWHMKNIFEKFGVSSLAKLLLKIREYPTP